MRSEDAPLVSVIIPVYNDPERLPRCLEALEQQTYPSDLYEVIVVDNGSEEPIAPACNSFPHVRTALELVPGSYAARNRGLSLARGAVIAFTDADAIPAADWIASGVAALRATPNCGAIGGRISLFARDPLMPTAVELYELVFGLPQEKYVTDYNFAVTANMFTSRDVLDRVGGFNPILKSNGDREWSRRVFNAGYKLEYAGEVCVAHPARRNFADLYKKTLRVTSGRHDRAHLSSGVSVVDTIRDIVRDLLGHPRTLYDLCFTPMLRGAGQRLRVSMVLLGLSYARAWVQFRLLLGWTPQIR
jgi:glycosyltransferase involved in cell wall biosynthesis